MNRRELENLNFSEDLISRENLKNSTMKNNKLDSSSQLLLKAFNKKTVLSDQAPMSST